MKICYSYYIKDFFIFFIDAKNALLLYLLPTYVKPSGKPQLSIATAQQDLIQYIENAAALDISAKQSPIMVIVDDSKTFETEKECISQILVCCDGKKYVTSSIIQALSVMYKYIWLFDLKYPRSCQNIWIVFQKYFFDMTYIGEASSPNATGLTKRLRS